MFIAITALKGGVGKTTTAIHLSAYLQQKAPTLLVDADKNRSALVWSKEEKLPFQVVSQAASPNFIPKYEHIVIDAQARPEVADLQDLAEQSSLLIVPTTPNHLDIDTTLKTVDLLNSLKANYKILLTQVDSRTVNGREARKFLEEQKLPLFKVDIPRLVSFERSPQRGVIVKDFSDPRAKIGWSSYMAIGKEILK